MGICFIGKKNYTNLVSNYITNIPGKIVDDDNKVLGMHNGLFYYTIGQRKGIGIGGTKNRSEKPWYVVDKKIEKGLDWQTTRTFMGSTFPGPGLFSKFYDTDHEPLVEVIRDTVGKHDTFNLACTSKYYEDAGYIEGFGAIPDTLEVEWDYTPLEDIPYE